ncbi:MAG: zf-HC2 domain-containing protein [Bullifex sp.]|nr:zf-HC2 domain-containing protein [Spirochaetales bacterium]MDY2814988.1 zf-HC2 domain-containing protein [Bullifex sp.]MDD7007682.1 zf-HC2 domain-containing protein [Spirochaetales bacterium]MDD7535270.1 zf-HC2 domain-containing protein [Spirochaetales bacterium]MDY3851194.1 zf-HC2 domain-containing protein [Bullifex sp.]
MCIDDGLLSSYLDGELGEPYRSQVEEHLSYCTACQSRLEKLKKLDQVVSRATLSDEELCSRMDQTLSILEKKCFEQGAKKLSFWRKKLEVGVPAMVTAAAGIIVVFIGSFAAFGRGGAETSDIMPSFSVQAGSENIHLVSSREQGLDAYSLEEIMKYLDSKGYNVDISIKGLTPIE